MQEMELRKKLYMREFEFFDGDGIVTLNIVDFNEYSKEINVAVTRQGKISVLTYPLYEDEDGWFFEYGPWEERINVNDFEEVE